MSRPTAQGRFEAKYEAGEGINGCWVWTAAGDGRGYGVFWDGRRQVRAHRFAYSLWHGPAPAGLDIDHLCRNRGCVNPAHLRAVSRRENVLCGEGHTARNASKTHCPRGHAYSEENTYAHRGSRHCRECCRARRRTYEVTSRDKINARRRARAGLGRGGGV